MRLEEELRGLADDVPRFVRVDVGAAWAAGRRRRVRRAAAVAVAVVLVALTAGAGLRTVAGPVVVDPADGDERSAPSMRLPTRIDGPWRDRQAEPGRPIGPVAGVVHRLDGDTGDLGWSAVDRSGHLWHLPSSATTDDAPAVSPDGSTVAFMQRVGGDRTRFVVANVETGAWQFLSHIGNPETHDGQPTSPLVRYGVQGQSPAYFSPDGRWIVVFGTRFPDPGPDERALLIDTRDDGSVDVLSSPEGTRAAMPAGWLDDDRLVWVDAVERAPVAVVTTRELGHVATVHLQADPADVAGWSQWVGPVSPDARMVQVGGAAYYLSGSHVGERVESPSGPERAGTCPAPEAGVDPIVATMADRAVLLERSGGAPVVVADPGLGIDCSVWAMDALHAKPARTLSWWLWHDSTGWLSWHWRETAAGLAALAGVGVLLVLVRRRRRLASMP